MPVIDRPFEKPSIETQVQAASDALFASDGHDYGPITDLLAEYYGDGETTASICSAFADTPVCLRIAAVNIQVGNIDPQWQQQFCELERQVWQAVADDSDAEGHFQDCMAGLPFLAR